MVNSNVHAALEHDSRALPQYLDQLDQEHQSPVRRDLLHLPGSVSEPGGDRELVDGTGSHEREAFLPAADDLGDQHAQGFAAAVTRVEWGPIGEPPGVVDEDAVIVL